jgi:hypothetical protein
VKPANRRDTPGLHAMPECGKLMWFNIPASANFARVTTLAVHSLRLGRGWQNITKLQLESFPMCARSGVRAECGTGLTEEQRCANAGSRVRDPNGCRMYTGEKRYAWRHRRSASG